MSRLLSHTHAEVRRLGELLRRAAQEPAYDVSHAKARELLEEIGSDVSGDGERASDFLLREVRVAPTLMKYAEPNAYEMETRRESDSRGGELLANLPIEQAPMVDLLDDDPLEVELATTLLYQYAQHSYRQIRDVVSDLPERRRTEIIELGLRHRGRFDEVSRAFCSGQQFRFDILMDIGGFRDMHRHRRCVQIMQDYTTAHGYEMPEEIESSGLDQPLRCGDERARDTVAHLAGLQYREAEEQSQYGIPLAFRKRTLFKMDFAEAALYQRVAHRSGGTLLVSQCRLRHV